MTDNVLRWECDRSVDFVAKYHQYYIDGRRIKNPSVTGLISLLYPPFSAKNVLARKYPRKSMNERKEIYLQWQNTGKLGTLLHAYIEDYIKGRHCCVEKSVANEFYMFLRFYITNVQENLVKCRSEHVVWSPKHLVCGSVDFIYQDNAGKYHLIDWKRCDKVDDTAYGRLVHPFADLPASKVTKFSLQLNIYKYMYESHYNIKIDSMRVAVFHGSNKDYQVIDVPNLQDEASQILEMARTLALKYKPVHDQIKKEDRDTFV